MGEIARRVTAMEAPRVAVQRQVFGDPEPDPGQARPPRQVAVPRAGGRAVPAGDRRFAGAVGLVEASPVRAVAGTAAGAAAFAGLWWLVSFIPDGLLFYVPLTGLLAVCGLWAWGAHRSRRRMARVDQVLDEQQRAAARRAELEQARERRPVEVEVTVEAEVVDEPVREPIPLPASAVQVPPAVRRRVVA